MTQILRFTRTAGPDSADCPMKRRLPGAVIPNFRKFPKADTGPPFLIIGLNLESTRAPDRKTTRRKHPGLLWDSESRTGVRVREFA